jgi:hypothetical protein
MMSITQERIDKIQGRLAKKQQEKLLETRSDLLASMGRVMRKGCGGGVAVRWDLQGQAAIGRDSCYGRFG